VYHHGLPLGHLIDRVSRAFLAEAAVFQAAVGNEVGAPGGAPVDVQAAGIDLAGEFDRGVDILREDAGRKAVARVVGERNRFLDVGRFGDADSGAEEFSRATSFGDVGGSVGGGACLACHRR
jgi:hypothetical protein